MKLNLLIILCLCFTMFVKSDFRYQFVMSFGYQETCHDSSYNLYLHGVGTDCYNERRTFPILVAGTISASNLNVDGTNNESDLYESDLYNFGASHCVFRQIYDITQDKYHTGLIRESDKTCYVAPLLALKFNKPDPTNSYVTNTFNHYWIAFEITFLEDTDANNDGATADCTDCHAISYLMKYFNSKKQLDIFIMENLFNLQKFDFAYGGPDLDTTLKPAYSTAAQRDYSITQDDGFTNASIENLFSFTGPTPP